MPSPRAIGEASYRTALRRDRLRERLRRGKLFVTDRTRPFARRPGVQNNSSRIVMVDPKFRRVTPFITGLPTGDHPAEQIDVQGRLDLLVAGLHDQCRRRRPGQRRRRESARHPLPGHQAERHVFDRGGGARRAATRQFGSSPGTLTAFKGDAARHVRRRHPRRSVRRRRPAEHDRTRIVGLPQPVRAPLRAERITRSRAGCSCRKTARTSAALVRSTIRPTGSRSPSRIPMAARNTTAGRTASASSTRRRPSSTRSADPGGRQPRGGREAGPARARLPAAADHGATRPRTRGNGRQSVSTSRLFAFSSAGLSRMGPR